MSNMKRTKFFNFFDFIQYMQQSKSIMVKHEMWNLHIKESHEVETSNNIYEDFDVKNETTHIIY